MKKGKVYAVGTEDMDALTFGSNVLLRHLTFSEARKMPIKEFYHDKVRIKAVPTIFLRPPDELFCSLSFSVSSFF